MKKIFLLVLSLFCIYLINSSSLAQEQIIKYDVDVLVVGGSQSGVMAAIQASRIGSKVLLVTTSEWLGGSSVKAGVSAIDGNELLAFQTGLWGEFLHRIAKENPDLMEYGWVSLFTFNPQTGQKILKEWVESEKNITWIKAYDPIEVLFEKISKDENDVSLGANQKVTGVIFKDVDNKKSYKLTAKAKVTIDATELGDLLALGNISHRIGWEYHGQYQEPSAPEKNNWIKKRYPVQELTWVFYLRDFGEGKISPVIPKPVGYSYEKAAKMFWCAFENEKLKKSPNAGKWLYKYKSINEYSRIFSPNSFITYGQISPDLFMINWPTCGNDYSQNIQRIFSENPSDREEFYKEARTHSLWFARYIQDTLGRRFGLAHDVFPANVENGFIPGFANLPYYRESRRVWGVETYTENAFLPQDNQKGVFHPESVAIGNYVNDHHYWELAEPDSKYKIKFAPKSLKWGGRYTGTPFSIPVYSLIPVKTDGLLVAEKSISVSHMANGATRLQPVCMQIGQAAGAIAALSAQKNIQPYVLDIKEVQEVLLNDKDSPATLVPFFNMRPENPERVNIQKSVLSGEIEFDALDPLQNKQNIIPHLGYWNAFSEKYCGKLIRKPNDSYSIEFPKDKSGNKIERISPFEKNIVNSAGVITFDPDVYKSWQNLEETQGKDICFLGKFNHSGSWFVVTKML